MERTIVHQYYEQLLEQLIIQVSNIDRKAYDRNILQLLDVASELAISDQNGDLYGDKLIEILKTAQPPATSEKFGSSQVLSNVLEAVLTQSRSGVYFPALYYMKSMLSLPATDTFQHSLVSKLLSSFQIDETSTFSSDMPDDASVQQSPKKTTEHGDTLVLILAALTCEYAHILSSATASLGLQTLTRLLESSPSAF